MAKVSDRLRGFDVEETGGAFSGLLAEEDELDRPALWRLGTWAAVSIGAVIVALVTNQSSVGQRRERSASADLLKQAQQLQLGAKESQSESRRLASAVETLNSDRDRLYSRVAVLEQGLDSVTGAIARQTSVALQPSSQANPGQSGASQASRSQAGANAPSSAGTSAVASTSAPSPALATSIPSAPAVTTASAEPSPAAAKPSPAPVVASVAATAPAALDKHERDRPPSTPSSSDPSGTAKSATAPQPPPAQQATGSLMASKSMMAPPDPAAGKLIEPAPPPKAVTTAPLPELAAVVPKVSEEAESEPTLAAAEVLVRRTEFGVDVGGANSIPGLRALWRGLVKSRANAALAKLRPIIVIKENSNGLGMQLRLIAGPIGDAAAAAKICASLTVSDRSCVTSVFEGQRLAMGADEPEKIETNKAGAESKPEAAPRYSTRYRHYSPKHPKVEDPPKPEPSTLSSIFGRR